KRVIVFLTYSVFHNGCVALFHRWFYKCVSVCTVVDYIFLEGDRSGQTLSFRCLPGDIGSGDLDCLFLKSDVSILRCRKSKLGSGRLCKCMMSLCGNNCVTDVR